MAQVTPVKLIIGSLILVCVITALVGLVLFPEQLERIPGGKHLLDWIRMAFPMLH